MILGGRQHATRAARRIEDVDHGCPVVVDTVVVRGEEQFHHEFDDLAGGEVLTGGLVRGVRELTDQLLEDVAHIVVVHDLGAQVDLGELLDDEVEQVGVGQALDLQVEGVVVEDLGGFGGEAAEEVLEVLLDLLGVRVGTDRGERLLGEVVEVTAGRGTQDRVLVLARARLCALPHRFAGVLHHAVHAAQQRHRQDDLAVLGTLVVAAQEIGHRPDEIGQLLVLVAHSSPSTARLPRGLYPARHRGCERWASLAYGRRRCARGIAEDSVYAGQSQWLGRPGVGGGTSPPSTE